MSFTPPEAGLPALTPILTGDLWETLVRKGLVFPVDSVREAVRYVRLKPGVSCRLAIFADSEPSVDNPPPGFLLWLFPDAERAREAYGKELTRRHVVGEDGYELFLGEDPPLVGVPYPNDPELPDLRHIYQPERFRRTLSEILPEYDEATWRIQRQLIKPTLLAYKPGRRAVYRLKVKLRRRVGDEKVRVRLHAKFETAKTSERSWKNLTAIHGALPEAGAWRVPDPKGFVAERQFIASEWVAASSLLDRVREGGDDLASTAENIGGAIAGLHGLDLSLDHLPSPMEEGGRLDAIAGDIAQLLPDHAEEIRGTAREIARRLGGLSTSPSAIVHGDLHLGQVLLAATPVIVDLDRAGRGYALSDVGAFLAHAREVGAPSSVSEGFLSGYSRAAGADLPGELVTATTAAALFHRSVFPFRMLLDDWQERTIALLADVNRLLSRQP